MSGKIFISYSKKDKKFATKLAKDLEEAGHTVWFDQAIGGGEKWRRTIEENIEASSEVVVVLSPDGIRSRWVQHEGSMAYALKKSIFPIMKKNVNMEMLPIWMEEIQYIDFETEGYENGFATLNQTLTPPNPVQELLDQQVVAYTRTGDLLGEAMLHLFDENRKKLTIGATAKELMAKSKEAFKARRQMVKSLENQAAELNADIKTMKQRQERMRRGNLITAGLLLAIIIISGWLLYYSVAVIQNLKDAQKSIEGEYIAVQETMQAVENEKEVALQEQENAVATVEAASLEFETLRDNLADAEGKLADVQKNLEGEIDLLRNYILTGVIEVGENPKMVLWDGEFLWVSSGDLGTIEKIDVSIGEVIQEIEIGRNPREMFWDGESLWVSVLDDWVVKRVNPLNGEIVGEFLIGGTPRGLYFENGTLWVANQTTSNIVKIDVEKDEVEGVFFSSVGPTNLIGGAGKVWVANWDSSSIKQIDIETGESETILVGLNPYAMAWDGKYLWVGNWGDELGNGSIWQIDPETKSVIWKIEGIINNPSALYWDGQSIWVTDYLLNTGNIYQINPNEKRVSLIEQVGGLPRSIDFDGHSLWIVNNQDNTIQQIPIVALNLWSPNGESAP